MSQSEGVLSDQPLSPDYWDYYNGTPDGLCVQVQNQSLVLVLGPYVHSVICVLGLIGNGLMLLTLCCSPRPPSLTQVLLLHLAVADLVIVLVLPGLVVMDLGAWPYDGVACKLLRGGYSLSLYSAALLLAAVSADRYAAVVHARRRIRARSLGAVRAVSAAVWLSAALLSVPNFIFYDRYVPSHAQVQDVYGPLTLSGLNQSQNGELSFPDSAYSPEEYVCELKFTDTVTARSAKVALPALQLTAGFLLPFLVMCFCYGSILHTLLKGRSLCGRGRGFGKGGQGFRRERAVRLVLMVALVFILCHAPFNILLLWSALQLFTEEECGTWDRRDSALAVAQTLALLHCVLNPLLYGFNSASFRTAFCSILYKLRPQRRQSTNSQSERSTLYTL